MRAIAFMILFCVGCSGVPVMEPPQFRSFSAETEVMSDEVAVSADVSVAWFETIMVISADWTQSSDVVLICLDSSIWPTFCQLVPVSSGEE